MYLFIFIFVCCISIQCSLEYGMDNTDGDHFRIVDQNYTAFNNAITTAAAIENEKVCDTAVNLQNILKVIANMLRNDIPETEKTATILNTLKTLLKNTAGDNEEVMFKINDLLHTLEKYNRPGENRIKKHLRQLLNGQNEQKGLKNELSTLPNSYCTEALLNIIKITYEAYASLAKNPICNLPVLSEFSSLSHPNPFLSEFIKMVAPLIPQSVISDNQYLTSTVPPLPNSDYTSDNQPSNKSPTYIVPLIENILNPENSNSKPTPSDFEHLLNINSVNPNDLEYHPDYYPFDPQNPNMLNPNQILLNNALVDFSPGTIETHYHTYPTTVPMSGFPYDGKSHSLPYNSFTPNGNIPQNIPEVPWSSTPEKSTDIPFYINPNGPYENAKETTYEFPIYNQVKIPEEFQINPHLLPYYSFTPNANIPQNIPEVPWSSTPEKSTDIPFYINPNGPYENEKETTYEFPIYNQVKIPEEIQINPVINSIQALPQPPFSQPENLNNHKLKLNYVFDPKNLFPNQITTPRPNMSPFFPVNPMFNDKPNTLYPKTNTPRPEMIKQQNLYPFFPVSPMIDDTPNALYPKIYSRKPDVIEQQNGVTPKFFPVGSTSIPYHILYPNNQNIQTTNIEEQKIPVPNSGYPQINPESELLEFTLKPNDLSLNTPVENLFVPKENIVYKYKIEPIKFHNADSIYPNIPSDQNAVFEFRPEPNRVPAFPNQLKPTSYDWLPSVAKPQNLNLFLPNHNKQHNTLDVSELKIVGFMREAIAIIEGVIPIIQFDQPTLSIIEQIRNVLAQKDDDIKAEQFTTILESYMKLINYIEQLKAYKKIIDIIDLSHVTNPHKLENKKVVELTYLVKRPQPVLYYPYYYVKYRLPYASFLIATNRLLKQKPQLRINPKQLYDELLTLSQVSESSPDLKNYKKEDILQLTFKSGSLVDTKLVANGTLDEQISVLREITSDLTANEILKLNNETSKQIQLVNHTESENNNDTNEFISSYMDMLRKENDEVPENNQETDRLAINANDQTTESNLGITSFDSTQLRRDILLGDVGLPFIDYVRPANVSPLHEDKEPNTKINPAVPAMYKLFQATLEAKQRIDRRGAKPLVNSGGLINYDNSVVSLNSGTGNKQIGVTFYNQKNVVNSAKINHHLLQFDNSQTSLNFPNRLNSINKQNDKEIYQELLNQHNIETNQQNYYNTGGLINFDNQKVSLNTGSGNYQDKVNFVNPKEILNNDPVDFDKTRTSKTPSYLNFMNDDAITLNNDETSKPRFGVTNEGLQDESVAASDDATTSYNDLVNYAKGMQLFWPEGINNLNSPNRTVEQSTEQKSLVVDPNKKKHTYEQEMADFVKNSAIKQINQYDDVNPILFSEANNENTNPYNYQSLSNGLPLGQQGSINNQLESPNSQLEPSNGQLETSNSQQQSSNNQLEASDDQGLMIDNIAASINDNLGAANQGIINYDEAKLLNTQNANYGLQGMMGDVVPGQQINSYLIQSVPIYYRRPVLNKWSLTSSPLPFVTRYKGPYTTNRVVMG